MLPARIAAAKPGGCLRYSPQALRVCQFRGQGVPVPVARQVLAIPARHREVFKAKKVWRMKTIILGLGNMVLTDDAVGIRIAQELEREIPTQDVVGTSEAGIALLDYVVGYDRLVIIDSIMTGKGKAGELYKLELADLKPAMNLSSSHGVDIATAFRLGERLGYSMPSHVSIYAVEINDNTTLSEECTQEVEESIPSIVRRIVEEERL